MTILTDIQRSTITAFQDVIYETIHELEEARDQFPKDYYSRFQKILKALDTAYAGLELIEVEPSLKERQAKAAKHGRRIFGGSVSVKAEWEMACPNCGSDERISIATTVWVRLTEDGTDTQDLTLDGSHEWDNDSLCVCGECGHSGTVREFEVDDDEDEA